jgi:hypothetical protein
MVIGGVTAWVVTVTEIDLVCPPESRTSSDALPPPTPPIDNTLPLIEALATARLLLVTE